LTLGLGTGRRNGIESLADNPVTVTGRSELNKGRPEIGISSAAQIVKGNRGNRRDGGGGRPDACHGPPQQPCRFPQLYLLDPDRNIVEINGAP
jgi:hypothetical protein